jgi:AraC-like DNA-binding protein
VTIEPPHDAPAVSVQILRGLLHVAERAGVPGAALVSSEVLELTREGDSQVSLSLVDRVCERAIERTGDPALGLHWVERRSQSAFVPVPYLALHAASLRQAFEFLSRFSALIVDRVYFELIEDDVRVTLREVPLRGRSPAMERFASEMFVGGFINLARSIWPSARFAQIHFRHAAPPYRDEYTRIFEQEVLFGQPFTEVVLDRDLFDAPSAQRDDELASSLLQLAQARLAALVQQPSFARRTHNLLVNWAPMRVTMAAVASALGISARSLRRRLRDEGKSYVEVEYDALGTVAARLLREQRWPIKEVAFQMGFSDVNTFHRAFKRWTGKTPNHVRSEARQGA